MKFSKPSFEDQIRSLRHQAEVFVHERAVEIAKSSPGVPVESIEMMISAGHCHCSAALGVIETRKRDALIEEEYARKISSPAA